MNDAPDTDKTITEIITRWVTLDTPFTAYTVFQEMRKRKIDVPYTSVKKNIHEEVKPYIQNKIYVASKVTSSTGDAILYHPPGYDTTKFFANSNIAI